ncbi:hypothetical protein HUX88_04425 [Duganella sp. BJB1802]|uniref:hypothetical protein n=1 Tax=Duganella sp. BJB1802 TaxID=2744575 RepID=UPI0015943148|nr:hypothetical protein [Duganella sp. BJB1802]NVD69799.1 hypothetical protein [Duganella sp. BJB1802]
MTKFFSFLSVFFILSGCANYGSVRPVRIEAKSIENAAIQPAFVPHATSQIRGGVGVAYTTDPSSLKNVLGHIASGVAGGVAAGNADAGIAFMITQGDGTDQTAVAPSPFGKGVAVDIPNIYFNEVVSGRGTLLASKKTQGAQGVVLKPSVNLIYNKNGDVNLVCNLYVENYESGKSSWNFRYVFVQAHQWKEESNAVIDDFVFHSEVVKCFKVLDATFRAHASGSIDNSFKPARLTYQWESSEATLKGMFYKNELHRVYLRYTADFIEIRPFEGIYSFKFDG